MEPIWIELEGKQYDLRSDIEDIDWADREDEEDIASYYQTDVIVFVTKDGGYYGVHKEDLDPEILEYVNQFVDPM